MARSDGVDDDRVSPKQAFAASSSAASVGLARFSSAGPPRRPSVDALTAAEFLNTRVKGRKAQVRRRMIERLDNNPEPPPLARLLRGGRGGAVRTKLLLSILWVAAGEGHDVRFPARAFA